MADIITLDDLPVSIQNAEMVETMIAGANARASRVAPCLADSATAPTEDQLAEARLVLIGAVKRWVEAGSGAVSQKMTTTGPYTNMETVDTRQKTGFNLWPSEIVQLQDLCKTGGTSTAFSIDVAPGVGGGHLPWCSANFGAGYCSCGVDIAGKPIYELG